MNKKIIKNEFEIEIPENCDYNEKDLNEIIDDCLKIINNRKAFEKETVKDSIMEDVLIHSDYNYNQKGDFYVSEEGFKNAKNLDVNDLFTNKKEEAHEFASEEEARKFCEEYEIKDFNIILASDVTIQDIPLNAPEENIDITYTEKLKGGKSALTSGMIEEAFKQRSKDEGKTFEAYIDVVIESLKDDIKNAKYIVSGEMKPVRSLLLEDYIKIEQLIKKAGLNEKLAEMQPLVDELSEKLNLNYWKKPKFKKSEMKSAAKELRSKHRWDSRITKTIKPVFLCSKLDLTASYNDAKQGKLPQVFEGNLKKVEKDIEADYDRINQGRDHYLEDPRIVKTLPEIIDLYETAIKYAEDLGYREIATQFAYMLNTIKKGWGLE